MDIVNAGRALFLVVVANLVPWAVRRLLDRRWSAPLDLGVALPDGQRLFGSHKTWRGVVSGTLACAIAATLTGPGFAIGAGVGALSLMGDALSSAVKRRLRLAPGTEIFGLDQLPEALLPSIFFAGALGLGGIDIAVVALVFLVLDILVTGMRHRPRLRNTDAGER
ncbi:MAG TPA: CDP-archaeol synthase [Steroidobacteraceae bacterium]